MNRSRPTGLFLAAAAALCAAIPCLAADYAVFNFQMQSDTPEWKWLEKGLSDRIATDFFLQKLGVVARDEMQLLADRYGWVPEMATTDATRMGLIRKQLRMVYVVTGVYRIDGTRIRITGQIIKVESREEVCRREVSGDVQQILALQRRLSAALLVWIIGGNEERYLRQLPVWTRNLPAMEALYEGMDLYDQGRYGEAWLKFRQASRKDPDYVEAAYWVGKMYYFMCRYEHAQRALERFVYLDTAHPRIGDAVVEYLHTYEVYGVPDEVLLRLYEDFSRRFPEARVGRFRIWTCPEWLAPRSQRLTRRGQDLVAEATSPTTGAVDVRCENLWNIIAKVDDTPSHWCPGLVGGLSPGEHTLRVSAVEPDSTYASWTGAFRIEADKVTVLRFVLPWKQEANWAGWTTMKVSGEYVGDYAPATDGAGAGISVQADAQAIRLVWTHGGDLWSAVSTDGRTLTGPTRLDLPVSSGWQEIRPHLIRDESGRFLLILLSDRSGSHTLLPYACWSRDFVHWSAPARIADHYIFYYDLIQDDRGRYVWVQQDRTVYRILVSRDAYHWEPIAVLPIKRHDLGGNRAHLLQRSDGVFELFTEDHKPAFNPNRIERNRPERRVSRDLCRWSDPLPLGRYEYDTRLKRILQTQEALLAQGRSVLLMHLYNLGEFMASTVLLAETADGAWRASSPLDAMVCGQCDMAWHRRWGYVFAWYAPEHSYPVAGPYLLRGPSLDAFFAESPDKEDK
ncbi:MAG TPA: hypothetical protein VM238_13540 [Phycisphaerae bacterium]|nr:hypothetical protein [Phycisphaerae bacterium]